MRHFHFRVTAISAILIASASAAPGEQLHSAYELLDYVPASTESVFVVVSPFEIERTKDLESATMPETSSYIATSLARQEVSPLAHMKCKGGISAVKEIRLAAGKDSVANGFFQSVRCEFLMLEEKGVEAVIFSEAQKKGGKVIRRGQREILKIANGDEQLLLAFLTRTIVCVANNESYLHEVLAIADKSEHGKAIVDDATFALASSLISKSALVWGLRVFSKAAHKDDPTSLRNSENIIDFYDPKALFVALELPKEGDAIYFHYASADKEALANKLPASVATPVKGTTTRRMTLGETLYTSWTICSIVAPSEDNPSSLLFNGYCVAIGQGFML